MACCCNMQNTCVYSAMKTNTLGILQITMFFLVYCLSVFLWYCLEGTSHYVGDWHLVIPLLPCSQGQDVISLLTFILSELKFVKSFSIPER